MQTVMNLAQINLLFIQCIAKRDMTCDQPTYHIKQTVRFIMRWSGLHCILVNTDGFLVLIKSRSQVHVFGSLIIHVHMKLISVALSFQTALLKFINNS